MAQCAPQQNFTNNKLKHYGDFIMRRYNILSQRVLLFQQTVQYKLKADYIFTYFSPPVTVS